MHSCIRKSKEWYFSKISFILEFWMSAKIINWNIWSTRIFSTALLLTMPKISSSFSNYLSTKRTPINNLCKIRNCLIATATVLVMSLIYQRSIHPTSRVISCEMSVDLKPSSLNNQLICAPLTFKLSRINRLKSKLKLRRKALISTIAFYYSIVKTLKIGNWKHFSSRE